MDRESEREHAPYLVASHNLTLENLEFSERLGGIPNPSLGIVRSDIGFNKYGEISLIADKDMVNPRKATNRIFNADVYSPRQPPPLYKIDDRSFEGMMGKLEQARLRVHERISYFIDKTELINYGPEKLENSRVVRAAFLMEKGVPFDLVLIEPKIDPRLGRFEGDQHSLVADPEFVRVATEITQEGLPSLTENLRSIASRRLFDEDGQIKKETLTDIALRVVESRTPRVDRHLTDELIGDLITQSDQEFRDWCKDLFSPLDKGMYFKSESGKNRDYTAKNLASEMKSMGVRDREGFTYGSGNARALLAREFHSFSEMAGEAGRIRSFEEFGEFRSDIEERYGNLQSRALPGLKWDLQAAVFSEMIGAAGRGEADLDRWLKDNRISIPDDVRTEALDIGKGLLEGPTAYFELKMQRAVSLDEFSAALVPEADLDKAKGILDPLGVRVIPYPPGGRDEIFMSIADEFGIVAAPQLSHSISAHEVRETVSCGAGHKKGVAESGITKGETGMKLENENTKGLMITSVSFNNDEHLSPEDFREAYAHVDSGIETGSDNVIVIDRSDDRISFVATHGVWDDEPISTYRVDMEGMTNESIQDLASMAGYAVLMHEHGPAQNMDPDFEKRVLDAIDRGYEHAMGSQVAVDLPAGYDFRVEDRDQEQVGILTGPGGFSREYPDPHGSSQDVAEKIEMDIEEHQIRVLEVRRIDRDEMDLSR